MEFCIFDCEMTAWEGSSARGWSNEGEEPEIIRIVALRINIEDGKVTKAAPVFDEYIKPSVNPVLSDYITKLTGIEQIHVKHADDFKTVALKFNDYAKGAMLLSFGGDDITMNYNSKLYGIEADMPVFVGKNLRPWFTTCGVDLTQVVNGETLTSGSVAKVVGVKDFESHPHQGQDDVLSLFHAMKKLIEEDGHKFPPVKQAAKRDVA